MLRRWLAPLGYVVALAAGVAVFMLVREAGSGLIAPDPPTGPRFGDAGGPAHLDVLVQVLIALIAIVGSARLLGRVARQLGQPPVIGETIAGLLLGPSFLGHFWPRAQAFVLPPQVSPLIQTLAQVGVILFMFLVGVELDPAHLRKRGGQAIAISHASIVVPFSLGAVLAFYLYPRLGTSDVPFTSFTLFVGISMSVTAFPVLARILSERGLDRSPLGALALTCAAVDDVTAWCLLALIVGVVQSRVSGALTTVALAFVFVATVFLVVRPLVQWIARRIERRGTLSQTALSAVLVLALASALATDAIGIHALFGAFAVGTCVPPESALARELRRRIEDLVAVLFLPVFFALTGTRTHVGLLAGSEWLTCALVVAVACAGKIGGGMIAARFTGLRWYDASKMGLLMNTRGLMELVVLNIGLELHVISPALFTILVIMAVVTTCMTAPLLGKWRGGA
jgi:Kef-type K+ transport system membrane component KefB